MDIKEVLNNENHLLKLLHERNVSIISMFEEVERLNKLITEKDDNNKEE